MKTTAVAVADLQSSVIAVPPLARGADFALAEGPNRQLLAHLRQGGVRTALYGGNANLYNIDARQFRQLLEVLPAWASDEMWIVPSIGPSYGQMKDQADVVRDHGYPTAMILPLGAPATPDGTATGVRRTADRLGTPIILYLKWEGYLTTQLVADLVRDGVVCAIKYAIVRANPLQDEFLHELTTLVDPELIVSGIGERPAIAHWREFGLRAFTSGSVCVAPRQSTHLLELLKADRYSEAEAVRQRFLPLEDLRDGIHPIRVLHDAVTESGVADMGPLLPLLSNLPEDQKRLVRAAAKTLLDLEGQPA